MLLNEFSLYHGSVHYDQESSWVWFPKAQGTKVSTMFYSFFNHYVNQHNTWDGWSNLWWLNVAPRAKHFIWFLLHNGIKTHEYLYRLRLGPQALCDFCKLEVETAEHLLYTCTKSQIIWNLISSEIRKPINLLNGITSGDWLVPNLIGNDHFTHYVIASTAWFIWKTRCNRLFRNEPLNCHKTSRLAIRHIREYLCTFSLNMGENFILNSFSITDIPFIFSASVWNSTSNSVGVGFIIVNSSLVFLGAGCCSLFADIKVKDEAKSLSFALNTLQD